MADINFLIEGIDCASCASSIEKAVSRITGVEKLTVSADTGIAEVIFDAGKVTPKDIIKTINALGYKTREILLEQFLPDQQNLKRELLYKLGTASFLSMQIMIASFALYSGYFTGIDAVSKSFFEIVSFVLSTPVVFYCGWSFHLKAAKGIIHRTMTMDTLISIGTLSAYLYSTFGILTGGEVYFDTSAMIITFILAGRTIEAYAKAKSSLVFVKFQEFLKMKAHLIVPGAEMEKEISADKIQPGDMFIVYPYEKIPCDAEILKGNTEIDESFMTGESLPVKKEAGCNVVGGTTNLWGKVECRAISCFENSYASKILALLKDSFLTKMPVQRFADKVVSVFTPLVILTALTTFIVKHFLGADLSGALMPAISVLIVACPCALGIATPLAISSAIASSLKLGILFRTPESIETLSCINRVIFDKTGTLTEGKFDLYDVITENGVTDKTDVIAKAASLEKNIQHPLSASLQLYSPPDNELPVHSVKFYPGKGVEGIIKDNNVLIGNSVFLEENGIKIPDFFSAKAGGFSSSGKIVIYFAENNKASALLIFDDMLRKDAEEVCDFLKAKGIQTGMLTGDSDITARQIAGKLGLEFFMSSLLPDKKLDVIKDFKKKGEVILFVGDGINDTPSIMEADVGMSMNEPSQLVPLSADIVLLNNNLNGVSQAINTGKRTMKIIKSNFFWAFIYNIIAIPFAASGFFPPVLSAALMSISSVSVCLNSLRT